MQEQKQEDILLNSERRALMDEIAELKQRIEAAWATNNRRMNRIVLTSDYLSVEQKSRLLDSIWEKRYGRLHRNYRELQSSFEYV